MSEEEMIGETSEELIEEEEKIVYTLEETEDFTVTNHINNENATRNVFIFFRKNEDEVHKFH